MAAIGQLSQGPFRADPVVLPGNEQFPDLCLRSQDRQSHHHHSHSTTSNGSVASSSTPTTSSPSSTTPPSPTATDYSTASPESCEKGTRLRNDSTGGSPTPNRTRRDKKELHAARLQRAGSVGVSINRKESISKVKKLRYSSSSSPADALAAIEPPHDQGLTRMAFAEQQKWITVQQKTFTKWYAVLSVTRVSSC